MAKEDDIAKWALLAVGAWALFEILKNKGKALDVNRCGNCSGVIRPFDKNCPWCGQWVRGR